MANELQISLTRKQGEVYKAFLDDSLTEILVGGGGSGGKTWGVAEIVTLTCFQYPGIAWLVGRDVLKKLKQSTWLTFLKVWKSHGIVKDVHYTVNMQDFIVEFFNGSRIFFMELGFYPSDPMYDRLGSLELTHAWIDEAQEVDRMVIDTITGRFRQMVKEYNITPKVILTCNPAKGHLYDLFIHPEKQIALHRKFIQILYTDNPHIDQDKYRQGILNTGNKVQIERLLNGNWRYDDTPGKLYAYDDILDMRTNPITNGEMYIIGDPARLGEDEAWIMVFNGWEEKETIVFETCTLDVYRKKVQELAQKYKVNMSRVLIDADGVGGGIVDELKCKPFHNGASPLQTKEMKQLDIKPNFENLKTQCYFKLQDHIKQIRINTQGIKQKLVEELDVVAEIDLDKDGKRKIVKKEAVKQILGRSPNGSDCLAMRCWFELDPPTDYSILRQYSLS